QKLWYMGPMYRHERPQKGRYRQFHQIGVEAFGMAGVDIEAEVLMLSADFWQRLGLADEIHLEINNLGTSADRARYGQALKAYLEPHRDALDEDSRRRLDSNVLRILDSKVPATREIVAGAPAMADYVDPQSRAAFEDLLAILQRAGIEARVNPALVRGLDYYNGVVFEWTTDKLGAQATVCAGGRYDGLSAQLGGTRTPAVGFAMGLERLLLLLEETGAFPEELARTLDAYLVVVGQGVQGQALQLGRDLRRRFPDLRLLTHCGGGKYNAQLKKAYASGARCALILEGDAPQTAVKVRLLEAEGTSEELPLAELDAWLTNNVVQR